jgi:hypothetical protein
MDSEAVTILYPDSDQAVLHAGRPATFLHIRKGLAIIRYRGGSHAVAVPPEALSLPPSAAKSRPPLAGRDLPLSRDPAV